MSDGDYRDCPWFISVLGAWQLSRDGNRHTVGARQQNLIAALAVHGNRSRAYLAGLFWPDQTQEHASGSLRSCIWQVTHQFPGLLAEAHDPVGLARGVRVDLDAVRECLNDIEQGHANAFKDARPQAHRVAAVFAAAGVALEDGRPEVQIAPR